MLVPGGDSPGIPPILGGNLFPQTPSAPRSWGETVSPDPLGPPILGGANLVLAVSLGPPILGGNRFPQTPSTPRRGIGTRHRDYPLPGVCTLTMRVLNMVLALSSCECQHDGGIGR